MSELQGMQSAQVRGFETVININVHVDGEKINVPLIVSLPYTLKENENPSAVRVWFLCDQGTLTCMNGVFDPVTGMITFTITHQSYFVVGYDPVLLWDNVFNDLSRNAYYHDAIAFMNQRGIMNGYGHGVIGAQDKLNRAQLATMLWNMEGNPMPVGSVTFNDVAQGAWYYHQVLWAAENGIMPGVSAGNFAPNAMVTYKQLAQILYNYAVNFNDYTLPTNVLMPESIVSGYVDAWDETEARRLLESGIFGHGDEFSPDVDTTRGEAALIIRDFIRFVAER